MSHIKHTDDAVSPVVGIMLMLVVTIIIAAVVSTMAGGLMTSTDAAPQVAFSVSSTVEKISDSVMTKSTGFLSHPEIWHLLPCDGRESHLPLAMDRLVEHSS